MQIYKLVCGNMENRVSHITTRKGPLFSLIVQSPCGREKSCKKEKRRLGIGLKGVGKMDFEGGNGGSIGCEWITT